MFEIGRALRGLVVEAAVGEEDERRKAGAGSLGEEEDKRPSASFGSQPEDTTTHGEREPAKPRPAVVTAPRPRATRPHPTIRAALRAADARFRRCAAVVEGSVFVEFAVEDGGTSFASANPIYETDPELLRCVQ
ncbi:MAG: hypothetical protein KC420_23205, partial [Myxococcales bacterium]|nr:hypothetical protein [Myxococcales bacterium]